MKPRSPTTLEMQANTLLDSYILDARMAALPEKMTLRDRFVATDFYQQIESYFDSSVPRVEAIEEEVVKTYDELRVDCFEEPVEDDPKSFTGSTDYLLDEDLLTKPSLRRNIDHLFTSISELLSRERASSATTYNFGSCGFSHIDLNELYPDLADAYMIPGWVMRKVRSSLVEILQDEDDGVRAIPGIIRAYYPRHEMFRMFDFTSDSVTSETSLVEDINSWIHGKPMDDAVGPLALSMDHFMQSRVQDVLVGRIYEAA